MSSNGNANAHNGHATPVVEVKSLLPEAKQYKLRPDGLPNSPLTVSVVSAILGGLLGSCLAFALYPVVRTVGWNWARPQLGVYLACMGLFHLCEFWTTAGWNPQKLTVDGQYPFSPARDCQLIASLPIEQRGYVLVLPCHRTCRVLRLFILLAFEIRPFLHILPVLVHRYVYV